MTKELLPKAQELLFYYIHTKRYPETFNHTNGAAIGQDQFQKESYHMVNISSMKYNF